MELPHLVHWLHELRHRHVRRVFRALLAYGIVAFALVEVAEPVTHAFHLPEWTLTFVVLVLALGFPVVAVAAWLFGPTPTAAEATAAAPGAAAPTRRRLHPRVALVLVGVGLLMAAPGVAYYAWRGRGTSEPAAGAPSIAVLPFADLSSSKDQEYFADGVADEILNALGHVEGLRVAGRTSSFYFKGKRLPEAIAVARKVTEIDPLYAWAWHFLATYENGIGRPDAAREAASRALEISPEHLYAARALGLSELLMGKPAEALRIFERNVVEGTRLMGTALAQHDLGNSGEERSALEALRARFGDRDPYEIALVYAWRGDRDAAFEWLERAFELRGGRGISRLYFRALKYDPLLRKLRDDPRYAALLRKMNLPVE